MTWKIKKLSNVKISNPILIEGLPGIGNVGKIAVDFLIDSLKAEKICEIYSSSFPHSVFINEDNLVELPLIELYCKPMKGKTIFLLTGDTQPLDEEACYEFCDTLLDIFQDFNGKEIITLSGIPIQKIPKTPKIYCAGNSKDIVKKYSVEGINNDLHGLGLLIGVSGLLLGLAGQRKIPSISLLAETYCHPTYLGVKGAKEILNILNKRLELNLDIKKLTREVESIEKEISKKEKEISKAIEKHIKTQLDLDYIA